MASSPRSAPLSVDRLLDAVERLTPAERQEFHSRLAARHAGNGGPDEGALIRAAQARLPAAEQRRLRRLIARSERGLLTPKELAEYQSLAQQAQRLDAARAEALAELARRRGQPVQAVPAEFTRRPQG